MPWSWFPFIQLALKLYNWLQLNTTEVVFSCTSFLAQGTSFYITAILCEHISSWMYFLFSLFVLSWLRESWAVLCPSFSLLLTAIFHESRLTICSLNTNLIQGHYFSICSQWTLSIRTTWKAVQKADFLPLPWDNRSRCKGECVFYKHSIET